MVIVFVIDYYLSKTDGVIISAHRFEEELIRQGHTVRVVAYGAEGENKFALKERRIPLISKNLNKFGITLAKFDKSVMEKAFYGADIIHLFIPYKVQKKSIQLARKMNIPVCAAFHTLPENITLNAGIGPLAYPISKFFFWYWKKTFYEKVRHIHCPSQFTADQLRKHNFKADLHIISNGVAPQFVPAEKTETAENKNFEILMISRLNTEKRQDLLIEAVAKSKYKNMINLTFAGGGPLKEKLIKMAGILPNKPVFEFFSQEELIKIIHRSDLYIHAADIEIEGISCMEAFSCGLVPVIGNAENSATRQFAIDGRCLFEAGDSDSLKDKIEYWIEHREELREMSARYIEHAKKYRLEASVKAIVKMFNAAINDYNAAKNEKSPT